MSELQMKTRAMTFLFLSLFCLLLVGTFLVSMATGQTIQGEVKFDPKFLDMAEIPQNVTAEIKFLQPNEKKVLEINASTVLLEGVLSPIGYKTAAAPPRFFANFTGSAMVDYVIWPKLFHMGITPDPRTPTTITLTITGNLIDGTPFTATGWIKVRMTETPVPPPPPPPPPM